MDPISAIAELFIAVIGAVAALVSLIAESLGFAAGKLAEPGKEGEKRITGKRLLLAFTPFLLIVVPLAGIVAYSSIRQAVQRRRVAKTLVLVEDLADRISTDVDERGRVIWPPQCRIPEQDVWGNPFFVRNRDGAIHQIIEVGSVGPDDREETRDDVVATRNVVLPVLDLGVKALRELKQAVTD